MDSSRYNTWIGVWEWFQTMPKSDELQELYGLLNRLWQDERKNASPEALAAFAGVQSKFLQTKQ
jgi:hypothetical protein